MTDSNKDWEKGEAVRILLLLFTGTTENLLSREEILKVISLKTYYNYGPLLYKYELAEPIKDGLKITHVKLTETGKRLLGRKPDNFVTISSETLKKAPVPLTLDEITELTDTFNRVNSKWEWKLVRKGVTATK